MMKATLPGVVKVSTPNELKMAVAEGVQDIIITNHMDLSGLPLINTTICPEGCQSPVGPVNGTRSIRV